MVMTTAKPRRLTCVELREEVFRNDRRLRVDRDKGIIYGVKVVGRSSPNTHGVQGVDGTDYELEALRKARPLYERINCNVDHPPRQQPNRERSAYDRFAWLEDIEIQEAGLFGDLHFLDPRDPLAIKMMNAAEEHPEAYALSHNATGKGEIRNRRYVVTEIPEVWSVDIVADGGTNRSLFEGRKMQVKVCEVLRNKVLPALYRGRKKRLERLLETALSETRSPLMEADEESKDHRDHMYGAMRACEEAGNDEAAKGIHKLLDPSKRIEEEEEPESRKEKEEEEEDGEERERSEMEGQGEEGPGEPGEHNEGPDGKGGPGAAVEGRRSTKKTQAGEVRITEARAMSMCRMAGIEATASLMGALKDTTYDQAMAMIEEVKRVREIGRKASSPRSTAPLREGRAATAIPTDLKSWAESLKA